jgi:hypothetical protein
MQANQLNSKYVVLPAIPESERQTIDDYKRIAERFNKIGSSSKIKWYSICLS